MNIVLASPDSHGWYIATVGQHHTLEWRVQGIFIAQNGDFISRGEDLFFADRVSAEKRCKSLARTKRKKRGYVEVPDITSLPDRALKWVVVDTKWVSAKEMVDVIRSARLERYVYFDDVNGIEEWFDKGVQYLGFVSSVDDLIDVHDKFGTLRAVMISRMRVEFTEAVDALPEEMKDKMMKQEK